MRNPFGEHDWSDVRDVITTRLRRKFPRARTNDIEDAVSLALVDLVDYWIQLSSSVHEDEPHRTFWQACKRGTWMATTFLTQEWDMRDMPLEHESTEIGAPSLDTMLPPAPSPEDIVMARSRRRHASKV